MPGQRKKIDVQRKETRLGRLDYIKASHLDNYSSSTSEDRSTNFMPACSGSPVKVMSRTENWKALSVADPVPTRIEKALGFAPSGKPIIFRKVHDKKKTALYKKQMKES